MSGFDTKKPATRAAVILPWEKSGPQEEIRAADARLEEAVGLTASIGLVVVRQAAILLRARRPATLLGSGQVEQLAEAVKLKERKKKRNDMFVYDILLHWVLISPFEVCLLGMFDIVGSCEMFI